MLPLPNTSNWKPRDKAVNVLSRPFLMRCQHAETILLQSVCGELTFNIDNFDSGPGVEDIVRRTLAELMPGRYQITSGTLNDCLGRTAGDSEVVVFNSTWFPAVKSGATDESRKRHLPIEGCYATLEVKQTLTDKTLDEAAEKLVTASRLFRPWASDDQITENRILGTRTPHLTNPLFTAIIATRRGASFSRDDLIRRFAQINRLLRRTEVIRVLCVLGDFACWWAHRSEDGFTRPATFQRCDLHSPVFPVMAASDAGDCPFYHLVARLLSHCTHSILTPEAIETAYGLGVHPIKGSKEPDLVLMPTPEVSDIVRSPVLEQYLEEKEHAGGRSGH